MSALLHLKPRYHVRPDTGWVNDPNGPVVDDAGTVHLFFQSRPQLGLDTPVEWGHATSTDWACWTIHPSAMTADIHPIAADGVWSGNAVRTTEGVRAYFSGFRRDHPYQSVVTATFVSGDGTFTDAQPCLTDPDAAEEVIHYRDPFVWQDGESWLMGVGTGYADGTPAVRLYRSADGLRWQSRGDLLRAPSPDSSPYGFMWECPQVLHTADQSAVLVSVMDRAIDGFGPVLCLTFRTGPDGTSEIVTTSPVDAGPDFYAASLLRSESGPVIWGWITEARDQSWWNQDGWAGALSLPRAVELAPDGVFSCSPLPALTNLRDTATPRQGPDIGDLSAQFEFELELHPDLRTQQLIIAAGDQERITLAIDHDQQRLSVDRSSASLDPRADASSPEIKLEGRRGTLRGFVDGSIIEVFLPDGTAATVRWYPTTPPPWRLTSTAGDVRVWHLKAGTSTAAMPT